MKGWQRPIVRIRPSYHDSLAVDITAACGTSLRMSQPSFDASLMGSLGLVEVPGLNTLFEEFVKLLICPALGLGKHEEGGDQVEDRYASKKEANLLSPAGVLI